MGLGRSKARPKRVSSRGLLVGPCLLVLGTRPEACVACEAMVPITRVMVSDGVGFGGRVRGWGRVGVRGRGRGRVRVRVKVRVGVRVRGRVRVMVRVRVRVKV